jgi:dTDP-glucose 4,6-dehydratase
VNSILVTGGSGFIGSNFIIYLLDRYPEYCVVNLDKLTYAGNPHNLVSVEDDPRYRFVLGDICDHAVVDPLVQAADAVVNFAAESHVDRSILGGIEFVQTNACGTCVLLESARQHGVERFHQISTDEVYGSLEAEEEAWTEESPMAPRNPYAASKASAELFVRAYHLNHGVPTVVTRASNNIGPYQYPEKRVPLYITNAIDNLPLPVYGDGLQKRDHLHVLDHCAAIDLVLHSGEVGEIYNVGGENEGNGIEVSDAILARLDKPKSLREFVKDRAGHDQRYALDSSRIRDLGWRPRFDVKQAMAQTIDWYVEREDWWRRIKAGNDFQAYYKRQYVQR